MSELPTFTIDGKVSNRVTRLLDIPLDLPASVVLEEEIKQYPETRSKEIEELQAELERQYTADKREQTLRLSQAEDKLKEAKEGTQSERGRLQSRIRQSKENIERMSAEMTQLAEQLKKDRRAIVWMNVWRVFWGILYTVGGAFVIVFLIIKFILSIVAIFIPDSEKD